MEIELDDLKHKHFHIQHSIAHLLQLLMEVTEIVMAMEMVIGIAIAIEW